LNDPSRTKPSNPSISRSRVRLIIAILQGDGGSGGGEVGRRATEVCRVGAKEGWRWQSGSRRGGRCSQLKPWSPSSSSLPRVGCRAEEWLGSLERDALMRVIVTFISLTRGSTCHRHKWTR
jgi:hypothetical protein